MAKHLQVFYDVKLWRFIPIKAACEHWAFWEKRCREEKTMRM